MRQHEWLKEVLPSCESAGLGIVPHTPAQHKVILRRLQTQDLERLAYGVTVRTQWWKQLPYEKRGWCIIRTLAATHPTWILGGAAAAWAYGWTATLRSLLPFGHMTPSGTHPRTPHGIQHFYCRAVEMKGAKIVSGLRVSDPYRTLFDCGRSLSFQRALPIADAALRSRIVTREKLIKYIIDHKRWRRWRQALKVARHASPLAESGGESEARAVFIDLGFAAPQLQQEYKDPKTGVKRRVDFLWKRKDGTVVIGEFDGLQKYTAPQYTGGKSAMTVLSEEKSREDQLSLFGVWLFRITYSDLANRYALAKRLRRYGVPYVDREGG